MRRNPMVAVALALMAGIAGQHWLTAVGNTAWVMLWQAESCWFCVGV